MQGTNYLRWISEILSSCKRTSSEISIEPDSHTDQETSGDTKQSLSLIHDGEHQKPQMKKQHLTPSEKKSSYKAKLSYKKEWEKEISLCPWGTCKHSCDGMLCETYQEWGNSPAGSRGAWKTTEITDWNHANELLKQQADSQWCRDAAATTVTAQQTEIGKSVLERHCQVLHNRLLSVDRMFYRRC